MSVTTALLDEVSRLREENYQLREDLELQRKIDLQIIAEKQQLRGSLSLAEEGLANYAQENGQLKAALKGLSDMYARTWDRVDGALVMMPDSIPRFEKAHGAARIALGEIPSAPQTPDHSEKT